MLNSDTCIGRGNRLNAHNDILRTFVRSIALWALLCIVPKAVRSPALRYRGARYSNRALHID